VATSTYAPIATTTFSGSSSSYVFNSIPQTYTDLYVVLESYEPTNGASIGIQFNGDSGSNYSYTFMYGSGSSVGAQNSTNTVNVYVGQINSGTTVLASINNYSNTTTYKTVMSRNGASSQDVFMSTGTWRNTNAITSLTVLRGGNFPSGGTVTLFGIKAE
jgi:hypothetical protein